MKSNLPGTFGPTPIVPSGTAGNASRASTTASPWGDWQGESSAPGQQAFSRWLSQYRTAQATAESPRAEPARSAGTSPGAGNASRQPSPAARAPLAMPPARALTPMRPEVAQAQRLNPAPNQSPSARPAASHASAHASSAQGTGRPAPLKAAERSASRPVDDAAPEEASAQEVPQPVDFSTERGTATAWVQELQPPDDLPLTDPGAVLAWLGALQPPEVPLPPSQTGLLPSALDASQAMTTDGDGDWLGRSGAAALQANELMAAMEGLSGRQTDTAALANGQLGTSPTAALALTGLGAPAEALRHTLKETSEPMRHFTGNLSTPMDNPAFPQALAERVGMWVSGPAQHGPMTAELRLNPQELGPVHVRIELDGQSAQVDFAATHASTREAIEQTIPLLARALEEAGLSLSGSGVSDQGGRQAWQGQPQDQATAQSRPMLSDEAATGRMTSIEVPLGTGRLGNALGGLDLYA